MVTSRQAFILGRKILVASGEHDAPETEAMVLLCHSLKKEKTFIISNPDYGISSVEMDKYRQMLELRSHGMPLAYITSSREFMSINFAVSPAVLIPRQETEILVEAVIEHCGKGFVALPVEILDIGTGSGCIAISLVHYIKKCRVTAVDISTEAIALARINACTAGVSDKIEFLCDDLFSSVNGRLFDIIVSNPPYIPSGDIPHLEDKVALHEPGIALDGGVDGLAFYRRIAAEAGYFLKDGGMIAVEVGIGQAEAVRRIFIDNIGKVPEKSVKTQVIRDLSGIYRVVVITKSRIIH
jgi:release factor glutamine methyltransferase